MVRNSAGAASMTALKILIAILLISVGFTMTTAQAERPVLACLGDIDSIAIAYWPPRTQTFTEDTIAALQALEGVSIWVGYADGGYALPGDTASWFKLYINGNRQVWAYASVETGNAYLFVFDNLTPYADANGQHYGIHPCGMFAVERSAVGAIIPERNY